MTVYGYARVSTDAKFRCLDNPLIDTTTPHGALITQILAAIAEFERKQILDRTSQGRQRAMAKGIKFGRHPKLDDYQRQEAIRRREAGEFMADIARSYRVSRQTISRL
jgi:DNA invertase Pin-like site-specific DNA recombinase